MEFWPEFLANNGVKEFLAGGVGGMAGVAAGHPLDTIKTRIQQPSYGIHGSGAFSIFRDIMRNEGPLALYKGMSSPLATIAFQNAVTFHAYATFLRLLSGSSAAEPPSFRNVALAGIGAGFLQTIVATPVDLVKIRLQIAKQRMGGSTSRALNTYATGSGARGGPWEVVRNILRADGIRGLYRGLGVTIVRDAPCHAVYFATYEWMREWLHPGARKNGDEGMLTMLLAGGTAGSLSWVSCYPIDVVKSRLQAQQQQETGGKGYTGLINCLRRSVANEGPQVLVRGLGTTVVRAFFVNGAIFITYEMSLRSMSSMPPQDLGL